MPVAPSGTNQVHLTDGKNFTTNEQALSVALQKYAADHKREYSNLTVLGFEKNFHGLSFGTLSCVGQEQNTPNAPTYDWPIAPLP